MSTTAANNSIDLLRRLEPAVRPHAPASNGVQPVPFDEQSFDAILHQAFAGELRSGEPVGTAGQCDLQTPLDRGQLDRLAIAADRAQAAGARRALMMIDGRGLVIDVASRSILAELTPQDHGDIRRLDAAMVVPGASESSDRGAGSHGSPFAGINDLTTARLASASIAPKPR